MMGRIIVAASLFLFFIFYAICCYGSFFYIFTGSRTDGDDNCGSVRVSLFLFMQSIILAFYFIFYYDTISLFHLYSYLIPFFFLFFSIAYYILIYYMFWCWCWCLYTGSSTYRTLFGKKVYRLQENLQEVKPVTFIKILKLCCESKTVALFSGQVMTDVVFMNSLL